MNESILETIRTSVGAGGTTAFDQELVLYINTTFARLNAAGIGTKGFHVKTTTEMWSDFIDEKNYEMVKAYTSLKVKILFDGNNMSASLIGIYENMAKEYEWLLYAEADNERGVE